MAKTILVGGIPGGRTSTVNTTQFWTLGGATATTGTETDKQVIFRSAGTISNFYFNLQVNGITGTTVFTVMKNAAAGNSTVSFTAAGTAEDTTHTDVIAAGDKLDWKSVPGGATGTFQFNSLSVIFNATTNTISRMIYDDAAQVIAAAAA